MHQVEEHAEFEDLKCRSIHSIVEVCHLLICAISDIQVCAIACVHNVVLCLDVAHIGERLHHVCDELHSQGWDPSLQGCVQ